MEFYTHIESFQNLKLTNRDRLLCKYNTWNIISYKYYSNSKKSWLLEIWLCKPENIFKDEEH